MSLIKRLIGGGSDKSKDSNIGSGIEELAFEDLRLISGGKGSSS